MILRNATAVAGALVAMAAASAIAFGVDGGGGVLRGDDASGAVRASAVSGRLGLDLSGPVFAEEGLVDGETVERCITVTNAGSSPTGLALFGRRAADQLSPHLQLTITHGSRPDAAPGSCAGFTAATGDDPDFSGRLSDFPNAEGAAIHSPVTLGPGSAQTYRLEVRVTGGNAAQDLRAVQSFVFAATDGDADGTTTPTPVRPPAGRPPRPNPNMPGMGLVDRWCSRADVRDTDGDALKRIPGTNRWVVGRRMMPSTNAEHATRQLALRVWTSGRGTRLVLALGERWALGVAPPRMWSRVTYTLNGEASASPTSRPYVWEIDPERMYPGENRVRVAVQPRSGPEITAEFRFRTNAWGQNRDASVCTIG